MEMNAAFEIASIYDELFEADGLDTRMSVHAAASRRGQTFDQFHAYVGEQCFLAAKGVEQYRKITGDEDFDHLAPIFWELTEIVRKFVNEESVSYPKDADLRVIRSFGKLYNHEVGQAKVLSLETPNVVQKELESIEEALQTSSLDETFKKGIQVKIGITKSLLATYPINIDLLLNHVSSLAGLMCMAALSTQVEEERVGFFKHMANLSTSFIFNVTTGMAAEQATQMLGQAFGFGEIEA